MLHLYAFEGPGRKWLGTDLSPCTEETPPAYGQPVFLARSPVRGGGRQVWLAIFRGTCLNWLDAEYFARRLDTVHFYVSWSPIEL